MMGHADPMPFYDRQGNRTTMQAWSEALAADSTLRDVSKTVYEIRGETVEVSTVHIGIDYGFGRTPRPLIFETMVFGGPLNERCVRYATQTEAVVGHLEMCAAVLASAGTTEAKLDDNDDGETPL
jgi:hypothetical protein